MPCVVLEADRTAQSFHRDDADVMLRCNGQDVSLKAIGVTVHEIERRHDDVELSAFQRLHEMPGTPVPAESKETDVSAAPRFLEPGQSPIGAEKPLQIIVSDVV